MGFLALGSFGFYSQKYIKILVCIYLFSHLSNCSLCCAENFNFRQSYFSGFGITSHVFGVLFGKPF